MRFSPATMKSYLEMVEANNGKSTVNYDSPISYQVFFGRYFVSKAWRESADKEAQMVQKLDVTQLRSQRDAEITRWDAKHASESLRNRLQWALPSLP